MKIEINKQEAELIRSLIADWLDAMGEEDEDARAAMEKAMLRGHDIHKKLEVP